MLGARCPGAMADAAMNDGRQDAEMGGAAQQGGVATSPPMCSMLEFTQQMMADAEDQKDLVPIVARLIAKLVEENDKVSCTFRKPSRVLGDYEAQSQRHPFIHWRLSAALGRKERFASSYCAQHQIKASPATSCGPA